MKTITSDRLEQQVFTMARKGHFSYIPKGEYFLKGRKGDTIYYLHVTVHTKQVYIMDSPFAKTKRIESKTIDCETQVYVCAETLIRVKNKKLFRKPTYSWMWGPEEFKIPSRVDWQEWDPNRHQEDEKNVDAHLKYNGNLRRIW